MAWSENNARSRIESALRKVETVEVVDYSGLGPLNAIPIAKAVRVDGVHLYVDIMNMEEVLGTTATEGERSHKRTLRFLDLCQRATLRVLVAAGAVRVDFHNQRLHAVVTEPQDDKAARVHSAVVIAKAIEVLLAKTSDEQDHIPGAKVRVGIDTGVALAVNNGRRGSREPLFLGRPANIAAKHAAGTKMGIYLTAQARKAIELDDTVDTQSTKLTASEIAASWDAAGLVLDLDGMASKLKEDLSEARLADYQMSRPTPPLKGLDFDSLTPSLTKRIDVASFYADIDGFTAYVGSRVGDNERSKDVVRTLHVLRSEMDAVLDSDFGGLKVRFIGDCLHGVLAIGPNSTDAQETVDTALLCAGALRSSFKLALEVLGDNDVACKALGLAIGIEYGPVSMIMLGLHGRRKRCCVGRSTLTAEQLQSNCSGTETALGASAQSAGSSVVVDLFDDDGRAQNLTYGQVSIALGATGRASSQKVAASALSASTNAALQTNFRAHAS
jgi:hypothetical protein